MANIESPKTSISEKALRDPGTSIQIFVFGMFLLVGGGIAYVLLIGPILHVVKAKSWIETPCVVISSRVASHRGSKGGTTYSVDIRYAYGVEGRQYVSTRYQFFQGSSGGFEKKWEIVRSYRPGQQAICFVDPDDPRSAVLERGFTSELYFGLIPLVFLVIGGVGLTCAVRRMHRRNAASPQTPWLSRSVQVRIQTPSASSPLSPASSSEPLTLKPQASPIAKLLGIILFSAFWNGIISVFIFQAWKTWRGGSPDWSLTLFMIPFVLVGLGTIVGVGYFFLALFNPRPKLTVSPGAIPLGGSAQLEWEVTGRADRIRRFCIYLEGREEATYPSGKSTHTDKEAFARIDAIDTQTPGYMTHGTARITVPPDTVPSFESAHNKIVWLLCVRGDIERWPDLDEEFPIAVLPMNSPGRSSQ
ncbi:MAG: DUF3592 domain-containing protein [Acidobacteriia bacterium]|nr:DUF3592 domain-containing protein [Terriglobia bacterium]